MGQKVHPYGFRVGYNKDWHSHWFAKQDFASNLAEDLKLKRELKRRFSGGGVSHIDIERAATRETYCFPSGYEKDDGGIATVRCTGHQGHDRRPSEWCRDRSY